MQSQESSDLAILLLMKVSLYTTNASQCYAIWMLSKYFLKFEIYIYLRIFEVRIVKEIRIQDSPPIV